MIPHLELLLLRLRKQLPHLLPQSPDVFVQNFRPVHDLWLARVQYLTDLARYQEQHTPDVVNTQLLYDVGRPYPGRERPLEDLGVDGNGDGGDGGRCGGPSSSIKTSKLCCWWWWLVEVSAFVS